MKASILSIIILLTINSVFASSSEFMLCYDFGCKSTKELSFDPSQWKDIAEIFIKPALSPWLEKQQIRRAIALMEKISGSIIGTSIDKGGNYPGEDLPYQQDCIDESTNTFQYLLALQNRNLLFWHRVHLKQRRIVWLATHWTAVIQEINNKELFAVDAWYRDNGEMPYIQKLTDWQRKSSFSELLNP